MPDQERASLDRCTRAGSQAVPWVDIDHTALAAFARRSLSASPRPFLRWAGSKRRLLPQLVAALPKRFRVYHEPFLGGGSLFFLLRPPLARLGDSCLELIRTYEAVSENPAAVLRHLSSFPVDRDSYYSIRANLSSGRFKRAAQFIYLNKVGWNGLYRVNSKGGFNVPYGAPKTDNVIDRENLLRCASALAGGGIELTHADFTDALAGVRAGDLVFLDPPYVTRHNDNGFIDYNERLFSWTDQERLATEAKRLSRIGATVIVTNAFHDEVLELFPDFERAEVTRSSTIASSTRARGQVAEAILVSKAAVTQTNKASIADRGHK